MSSGEHHENVDIMGVSTAELVNLEHVNLEHVDVNATAISFLALNW